MGTDRCRWEVGFLESVKVISWYFPLPQSYWKEVEDKESGEVLQFGKEDKPRHGSLEEWERKIGWGNAVGMNKCYVIVICILKFVLFLIVFSKYSDLQLVESMQRMPNSPAQNLQVMGADYIWGPVCLCFCPCPKLLTIWMSCWAQVFSHLVPLFLFLSHFSLYCSI